MHLELLVAPAFVCLHADTSTRMSQHHFHCLRRTQSTCRVAVRCLCGILDAVPHFNYISDVLQVIVPKLTCGDARMRTCARDAVSLLLRRGAQGEIMVEAVQLIADMVRTRKCACHPDTVRCLLVLDFKDIGRDDVQCGAPPCFEC